MQLPEFNPPPGVRPRQGAVAQTSELGTAGTLGIIAEQLLGPWLASQGVVLPPGAIATATTALLVFIGSRVRDIRFRG